MKDVEDQEPYRDGGPSDRTRHGCLSPEWRGPVAEAVTRTHVFFVVLALSTGLDSVIALTLTAKADLLSIVRRESTPGEGSGPLRGDENTKLQLHIWLIGSPTVSRKRM